MPPFLMKVPFCTLLLTFSIAITATSMEPVAFKASRETKTENFDTEESSYPELRQLRINNADGTDSGATTTESVDLLEEGPNHELDKERTTFKPIEKNKKLGKNRKYSPSKIPTGSEIEIATVNKNASTNSAHQRRNGSRSNSPSLSNALGQSQNLSRPNSPSLNNALGQIQNQNPLYHHDPLSIPKFVPTIVADTIVSTIAVYKYFHVPLEYGAPAWVVANGVAAVVASPRLLPIPVQNACSCLKGSLIDPVHWSYYTLAWWIMRLYGFKQCAFFIGVSGMGRTGVQHLLHCFESSCCPLNQQTANNLSLDWIASRATKRVAREFFPEIVAAFTRSGASNLYDYHYSKKAVTFRHDVGYKTFRSTGIYIGAFFCYHLFYRVIEQAIHSCSPIYQQAAQMDQKKLIELRKQLAEKEAPNNIPDNNASNEKTPLNLNYRANIEQTPKKNPLTLSDVSPFLNISQSPVIGFWKDPLWRFWISLKNYFLPDGGTKKAILACRTIDRLEMLQRLSSLPETQDRNQTINTLLSALKNDTSSINALIQMLNQDVTKQEFQNNNANSYDAIPSEMDQV